MDKFLVRGSGPLDGQLRIGGAKNSALKLMAASLLAEGTTSLVNVPDITDVAIMTELLEAMGVEIRRTGQRVDINVPNEIDPIAPYSLVERMRASIVVLGPLLARIGRARVAMPGGDDFGSRPIDMHLQGLEQLGATFSHEHGDINGRADRLIGSEVFLEFPSVGATENLLMASVLAEGVTIIENAAREPEITDLANFLSEMGVSESGVGSMIRSTYHLLGLRTYFTAGEVEVRAWTIHEGDRAPQAAGVIHTDFERGFIKAETVAYKDLVECGSVAAARDKGLYRMEGKEYVVKDGDVLLFKFNV